MPPAPPLTWIPAWRHRTTTPRPPASPIWSARAPRRRPSRPRTAPRSRMATARVSPGPPTERSPRRVSSTTSARCPRPHLLKECRRSRRATRPSPRTWPRPRARGEEEDAPPFPEERRRSRRVARPSHPTWLRPKERPGSRRMAWPSPRERLLVKVEATHRPPRRRRRTRSGARFSGRTRMSPCPAWSRSRQRCRGRRGRAPPSQRRGRTRRPRSTTAGRPQWSASRRRAR
mmetsp:Transcript_128361/g.363228  ORF Transcript_128361/g.363228 Transcript_128361/m.363228 type:complete len:231 (-) Transcript_128361:422-1114(-)